MEFPGNRQQTEDLASGSGTTVVDLVPDGVCAHVWGIVNQNAMARPKGTGGEKMRGTWEEVRGRGKEGPHESERGRVGARR